MDLSPLSVWTNLRNAADWRLRNALRWSPKARERAEEKPPAGEDETRWVDVYSLAEARGRMAAWRWKRNLAVVEVLERAVLTPELSGFLGSRTQLRVLDVGSKNFDYVDAVYGVLSSFGAGVQLTGVEIDAHRRYTDLRTRRAWAEHYASFVPGARYLTLGLEDYHEPCDLITWFYPFVTEYPLVRWGLPRSLFRPQVLFNHAFDLLSPGGWMVVVNLNETEAAVQHGLARTRGVSTIDLGIVPVTHGSGAGHPRLTLVRR